MNEDGGTYSRIRHVERNGKMRNACNISVGRQGKGPYIRPRHRCKVKTKMHLRYSIKEWIGFNRLRVLS
jgi:hypothetical protein